MKYLFCGSREWKNAEIVRNKLIWVKNNDLSPIIVVGGAKGADSIAEVESRMLNLPVQVFLPDWSLGRQAGILRNLKMLDSGVVHVFAFWDGVSPGTRHTIGEARKRGIITEVIYSDSGRSDRRRRDDQRPDNQDSARVRMGLTSGHIDPESMAG